MPGRCIVCHGTDLAPVVEVPAVPVLCNAVCCTREQALATPRMPMALSVCRTCGHLFNRTFDPARARYDSDYENSLHASPLFQNYALTLADRLIVEHDLHGKEVVEVGCGDGRFLELLCGMGGNRGVGFDPSGEPRQQGAKGEDVRVFADAYGEPYGRHKGDIVVCRHVLEHVADPGAFIDLLGLAMKGASARLYIEVPNGLYTLAGGLIWDLIYEHCSYFSEDSLARLLMDRGFALHRLTSEYRGQFLCADAAPARGAEIHAVPRAVPESVVYVASFATHFRDTVLGWSRYIAAAAGQGATIVGWGAGSKGVTFLNLVERGSGAVRHIVDVNPKKWGRFVAGTGQEIVCPAALRDLQPDLILLMNPIYLNEVRDQLAAFGLSPVVEVVDEGCFTNAGGWLSDGRASRRVNREGHWVPVGIEL